MQLKTNLALKRNYGGYRSPSKIKYIVWHYTENDGDTDESNADLHYILYCDIYPAIQIFGRDHIMRLHAVCLLQIEESFQLKRIG